MWCAFSTYALCTVYCVLCTVYCVLCTVYCVLCTVYCVLCTVYCVLCTVYCVLCKCVQMAVWIAILYKNEHDKSNEKDKNFCSRIETNHNCISLIPYYTTIHIHIYMLILGMHVSPIDYKFTIN